MPSELTSRIPEIVVELPVVMDEVVTAALEAIAEDAKQRAPFRTGALRNAIHVEHEGTLERGAWRIIAGDGGDVFYGHMVEGGHIDGAGGSVPPHPFLVPAFEVGAPALLLALRAALEEL